jgi:hypothetical protein
MTRAIVATGLALLAAGCARVTQFDRYYANSQWVEAAHEFSSDSATSLNDRELYRAALVYGTPGRPTFNALKGRQLLQLLLARFPETPHRDEAESRLMLLNDLLQTRDEAMRKEHELEGRIAELTRQTEELRTRADSSASQTDSLRGVLTKLETERREKEEQLRALRVELQQLKEIDLKSRPTATAKPIKPN